MGGLRLSREGRGHLWVSGPETGTEGPREPGSDPWREASRPPPSQAPLRAAL